MKSLIRYLPFLFLVGCAGLQRDCASSCANTQGSDWIIVQLRADGTPVNCWKLHDTSVDNEPSSDGLFWLGKDGHLVHISGWYNRVQVTNEHYEQAAAAIGVDLSRCSNGLYKAKDSSSLQ